MRKPVAGLLAFLMMLGGVQPALAAGYYVYCANNKIEVDSRDPNQMRIARGSGVCLMGSFGYRMDAESFARRNFGGAGARCSCR
ncbi:MAG: hypothetical protein IT557_11610 [Alphaproteobacteria bacterium]|nr:hypothetical protein [Alphaproteobacteria bacterium]